MINVTKDTPVKQRPLSILLIGPPGGGKTTLAMQFPNVEFYDCDQNLAGPERYIRKKRPDLAYGYCPIRLDDNGHPVPIEDCFDRLIAKLTADAERKDKRVAVVDSLTHCNEFVIRKILNDQRKSEMEARHWIPFKSSFYQLLASKVQGLGCTTICTVHESKLTEPDPKNMLNRIVLAYEPSVQGSITDYFGYFFTDVWRCTAEPAPGGQVEYVLTTTRTSKSDLKNSIGLPNEIRIKQGESMWSKLQPFINDYL